MNNEKISVIYDKFEMPQKVRIEHSSTTYARFVAEPLERGFGHTIGNALRRMLLTSIEAPAIISVFIEGVHHEYMAVEGIIEDMTNIILNLKGAILRKLPLAGAPLGRAPKIITKMLEITEADLGEKRQKVITVADLFEGSDFELLNPTHPIFTITRPFSRRVELKVAIGRGYIPSERHSIENKIADEIVIDSIFSPVRLVNYFVENTRVGQDTDFDRLIIDVTTDGRITPQEALSFAGRILSSHLDVFLAMEDYDIVFEEPIKQLDNDRDELMAKLSLGINEIELSVRSTNCLNGAAIDTIGELVVKTEPELLLYRNFGKKSLNEIKAKLSEMGLGLGMDLVRFHINKDNVRDMIKAYKEQHQEE